MSAATLAPARAAELLPAGPPGLAAHRDRYGPLPAPTDLVGTLRAAGLVGHGGAAFPTWRKLEKTTAVIVANGAEGEPASAKDATLLRTNPHLVLDGLELVAAATGARRAVLAAQPAHLTAARRAIAERSTTTDVVETVNHFLVGQESALVAAVEGRPALPAGGPLRIGAGRRPTLVLNVETLALVALIARRGAAWYRAQGDAAEPGLFLATVSGSVAAPGVTQVASGARLPDVLAAAGGPTGPVGAVLLGGYHGSWVTAAEAAELRLTPRGLDPVGARIGAGVVIVHPAGSCGLVATARITGWLADQSARQCGPCRNGLPRLATALQALATGQGGAGALADVRRYAGVADGRGACRHPDGTVRLVGSALRAFAPDVEAHLAGTCREESA